MRVQGLTLRRGLDRRSRPWSTRTCAQFRPTHVVHSAAAYKDPARLAGGRARPMSRARSMSRSAARAVGARRVVNFQTALCYGRPAAVPIPVDASAAAVHELWHFQAGGRELSRDERPAVRFVAARECHRPAAGDRPDPDLLQAAEGRASRASAPRPMRDFLDMADFFSLMDLVMKDDAPTGIFNVSTGDRPYDQGDFRSGGRASRRQARRAARRRSNRARTTFPLSCWTRAGPKRPLAGRPRMISRQTVRRMLAWYDTARRHRHLQPSESAGRRG